MAALDLEGRAIRIADAHRDDGKRFVVHADEILTAFLELESVIRASNGHDRLRYPSSRLNSHQRISAAGAGTRAVRRAARHLELSILSRSAAVPRPTVN